MFDVCVWDAMDVVLSVLIVRRRAVCAGSVSVSSCRHCMFVSCMHPVAVLNAVFCMTCILLMLVEDGRGILRGRHSWLPIRQSRDRAWSIYKSCGEVCVYKMCVRINVHI